MKRKIILTLVSILTFTAFFSSCDQSIDNLYTEKSRIQFKYYTVDYQKKMIIKNSSTFSFGMLDESILIDTAYIPVEYLGVPSDKDRVYNIRVLQDSTTAEPNVHFQPLSSTQVFRAGRLTDTIKVVVLRSSLSSSFKHPVDKRLALEMLPSDDFNLGMKDGLVTYLNINNYLSEPEWWSTPLRGNYIGFYHPKKWKILMSFNPGFTDSKVCPFDYNNQGRQYFQGLANYLNAIPTFDDETGDRIYIDRLVPKI